MSAWVASPWIVVSSSACAAAVEALLGSACWSMLMWPKTVGVDVPGHGRGLRRQALHHVAIMEVARCVGLAC